MEKDSLRESFSAQINFYAHKAAGHDHAAQDGNIHEKSLGAFCQHFKPQLQRCAPVSFGNIPSPLYALRQRLGGQDRRGYALKGAGTDKAGSLAYEVNSVTSGLEISPAAGTVDFAGLGFQRSAEADAVFALHTLFLLFKGIPAAFWHK